MNCGSTATTNRPEAAARFARVGWAEVLLPIELIEHGARRLLSYGAEVEVLEPPGLRQAVLNERAATPSLQGRQGTLDA